jgi:hypothetical protein
MKSKLALLLFVSIIPFISQGQSQTTEALAKKHKDALALFFYNNTLRMLNQTEDKAFDELIKDIEKMKFLMIKKETDNFDANGYKKLVSDYKAESFEEIMTSRHEGKSFDIFLKAQNSKTQGMLVLVNDDENLLVLDIVGSIAMNKITSLYDQMNKSTDLQKMLKSFTSDDDDRHKGKDDDNDDEDKDDAKDRKSKKN